MQWYVSQAELVGLALALYVCCSTSRGAGAVLMVPYRYRCRYRYRDSRSNLVSCAPTCPTTTPLITFVQPLQRVA
jgi:hypothetical protein